tara:strand:- start:1492 stop:3234 length:1743 start_codon:yes stop_codon:yes gene_type:complete
MALSFSPVRALLVLGLSFALAACDSGDININPATTDNTVDNSVSNSNNTTQAATPTVNPCASYENSGGTKLQGDFDGTHCTYNEIFSDGGANPILVDLVLTKLDNSGVHVFKGSLFMGKNYSTDAGLSGAGITKGGDGPTLSIEAGATIAFTSASDFIAINRGSKMNAIGTAAEPITFTSLSDINGTVAATDVQEWGGIVINGFGVTNKCSYTGSRGATTLTGECHVVSEGSEGENTTHYGGNNDEDSSGRLEYIITKHTGYEVATDNELNAITFAGVGSNTIVKNAQVYSSYDDGYEFFGGSVNVENYIAMYVRDDSIDIDEGYNGTITNALVIQSQYDGNRCIEADGIGSFTSKTQAFIDDVVTRKLNSRPTITNLTCIVSPNGTKDAADADNPNKQGTHDPGAGWRLREGLYPKISNSLLIASFGPQIDSNNWCIRADTSQTAKSGDKLVDPVGGAIEAGSEAFIKNTVVACETKSSKNMAGDSSWKYLATEAGGSNVFATISGAVDATADLNTDLILVEGTTPVFSLAFKDMVVDGTALGARDGVTYVGGLESGGTNWTSGWAVGLDAKLWFDATE